MNVYFFKFVIVNVHLISLFVSIYGQTVQDAKDLRTQLFTTDAYDFRVRPITNQSEFVNVTVEFTLLNVKELSELEETLKTTGYLYVTWTDSELAWTPATYGGLESTFFPQDEIWKPDIALKNSYSDYQELGTSKLNVEVSYLGVVEWIPFQVFTSTCSVDIRYFPFDTQHCSLKFMAWSYGKDEVYLRSFVGVDVSDYKENPSWELVSTSFSEETTSESAVIVFHITLRRKPLYALISIVFPVLALTVLNLFVFVLPCESGEKSGYAVTVFLTFAVFLTIVEASMPKTSSSVATLSVYLIIMTTKSTLITMIALAMLRCYTFDEQVTPIPRWLITLAKIGKFKYCRNRLWANKVNKVENENEEEPIKSELAQRSLTDAEKQYTWKKVINDLDAFCFLVFTSLAVLVTVLSLGISAGLGASV